MLKRLEYEGHFERTGEARLQIWDRRDRHLLTKHASEDARAFLSTVQPEKGKTHILVLAVSSGEFYGFNRNGDGFTERPMRARNGKSWWVAPGEELPKHHPSFEKGHFFRHHINKDPAKSIGDVVKSFYNDIMHRVELLCRIDNKKGESLVARVEDNEFPAVSMGCRIPYDVCNVCGNKAPTRAEYCSHALSLGDLTSEGIAHGVWNPSPDFFDISEVIRPADRMGFTLMKVADARPYELQSSFGTSIAEPSALLGEKEAELGEKSSELGKLSILDKIVSGVATDPETDIDLSGGEVQALSDLDSGVVKKALAKGAFPLMDANTLHKLSQWPYPVVHSTMAVMDMVPTVKEAFVLFCFQKGFAPTPAEIQRVGQTSGKIASVLRDTPQVLDQVEETGLLDVDPALFDDKVAALLVPWHEKRALYEAKLLREHVPEEVGNVVAPLLRIDANDAYYRPVKDMFHYADPNTGRVYQTTRSAAETADLSNRKKWLAEAGITGVLAGLAGRLGAGALRQGSRFVSPRAHAFLSNPHVATATNIGGMGLAGAGWLNRIRAQTVPDVTTLEGVRVPMNTEFVERRASLAEKPLQPAVAQLVLSAVDAHGPDFRAKISHGKVAEVRATLEKSAVEQPAALLFTSYQLLGTLLFPEHL